MELTPSGTSELERDWGIKRKVYAEGPPRVEFSTTEFGETLFPILKTLEQWGSLYLEELEGIRERENLS